MRLIVERDGSRLIKDADEFPFPAGAVLECSFLPGRSENATARFEGDVHFQSREKIDLDKSPILFLACDARSLYAHWLTGVFPPGATARFSFPVAEGRWHEYQFFSSSWGIRPKSGYQSIACFKFNPFQRTLIRFEARRAAAVMGKIERPRGDASRAGADSTGLEDLVFATFRGFPEDFRQHVIADSRGAFRAGGLFPSMYQISATWETPDASYNRSHPEGRIVWLSPGKNRPLRLGSGRSAALSIREEKGPRWEDGKKQLWIVAVPHRRVQPAQERLSLGVLGSRTFAYLRRPDGAWEPHQVVSPEALSPARKSMLPERMREFLAGFRVSAGRVDSFLLSVSSAPCVSIRVIAVKRGLILRPSSPNLLSFSDAPFPRGRARVAGTVRGHRLPPFARLREINTLHELFDAVFPSVEVYDAQGHYQGSTFAGAHGEGFSILMKAFESGELNEADERFRRPLRFRLGDLSPGRYRVVCRAGGRPVFDQDVRLDGGFVSGIDIRVRP